MRADGFLGTAPDALPATWTGPESGFLDLAVERLLAEWVRDDVPTDGEWVRDLCRRNPPALLEIRCGAKDHGRHCARPLAGVFPTVQFGAVLIEGPYRRIKAEVLPDGPSSCLHILAKLPVESAHRPGCRRHGDRPFTPLAILQALHAHASQRRTGTPQLFV